MFAFAFNLDALEMQLIGGRLWLIWIAIVKCVLFTLEEILLELLGVDHRWSFIPDR